MTKRICIIGLAKSGTSALYSSVKEKLPRPRRLMFEPNSIGELEYAAENSTENALTKLMFSSISRYEYNPNKFTHNIAIIRDPRDITVSTILFQFNKLRILNNKVAYNKLVAILKKKEKNPREVSVTEILEVINKGDALKFRSDLEKRLSSYSEYLDVGLHHLVTFDQMISGDVDSLNDYLGLELERPKKLEGWISKISRKGESGDWKNWFTSTDIDFFKNSIDPFLQKYTISDDWSLSDVPYIDPQYCSGYIVRLEKARREDPNRQVLEQADESSLLSAVEDGKFNAINHLISIYEKQSGDSSLEKVAELNELLGKMGYPRSGVLAARYYLKSGDRKRALTIFRKAGQFEYLPALRGLGVNYVNSKSPSVRQEAIESLKKGASMNDERCIKMLSEIASGRDEV